MMGLKFNHINLVVTNPEASALFYQKYLAPDGQMVWLGDSLHLRDNNGLDLAFQRGEPLSAPGAHHGFLATTRSEIEKLRDQLVLDGFTLTDDCVEDDFRSIKFLDPDHYEIEVYWEQDWPAPAKNS